MVGVCLAATVTLTPTMRLIVLLWTTSTVAPACESHSSHTMCLCPFPRAMLVTGLPVMTTYSRPRARAHGGGGWQ